VNDVTITETPETLASEILCTEILLYPSYPEDDKLKKHDRCSSKRLARRKIGAANIYSTHRDSEFRRTLLEHKPRRGYKEGL